MIQISNAKQLNACFPVLAKSFTPEGKAIEGYTKYHLLRQKLDKTCQQDELLSETYSICLENISKGEIIENLVPYVKGIIFNLIRKKRRQLNRAPCAYRDDMLPDALLSSSEDMQIEHQLAERAYRNILSSENCEILRWKICEQKKWEDIVEILAAQNVRRTIDSLRQMKCRAMPLIKDEYLRLRNEHGI